MESSLFLKVELFKNFFIIISVCCMFGLNFECWIIFGFFKNHRLQSKFFQVGPLNEKTPKLSLMCFPPSNYQLPRDDNLKKIIQTNLVSFEKEAIV